MGSCESFDGMCGCIAHFASSDLRLRCNYPIGHDGDHSWEKHRRHFFYSAGCGRYDFEWWLANREDSEGIKRGFKD